MKLSKNIKIFLVIIFSLALAACALFIDFDKPVELVWDKTGKKTDNLIIFFPGLYDTAEKFKDEEFFLIARKAGIETDMVSANVNVFHLIKEKVIERIETDVFDQAIKDGYTNIWLVGVSLGGLNSLLFYRKHSKEICGVATLAPYLANTPLINDLKNAKDITNWEPISTDDKSVLEQKLQILWLWLKEQSLKNNLRTIYLGYGNQDRYIDAIELFAKVLHKNNIVNVDGGHDWDTGQKIWQKQLFSRSKTGLLQPCR